MGNSDSRNAVVLADENAKNLDHLRRQLKDVRREAEIERLEREKDALKYQGEMLKAMSLVREEASRREIEMIKQISIIQEESARRDREQRESYERIFMIFFIILFAMWYLGQNEIKIESGLQALQKYEY